MTTNRPLISILVNCYNSEAFLKQALDSVYQQSYDFFEIILVDNCSTDKTAEIARSYDSKIKYVKTEKNIPLYAARNVGLQHVSGTYLCVLDSDDYWVFDKLEKQIEIMSSHPEVDILYTSYLSHYESIKKNLHSLKKLYLKLINFSDNYQVEGLVDKNSVIANYNVNFQTIMFKISALAGFEFDDRINLMGDLDFIFRLVWIQKSKIYFLKKVTAYSRIHDRQLSRKSDLKWVSESIRVLEKIKKCMTAKEICYFHRFFIKFYYSSYLLRVKKNRQALVMKFSYSCVSLRYLLHFFKSFLQVLKGSS